MDSFNNVRTFKLAAILVTTERKDIDWFVNIFFITWLLTTGQNVGQGLGEQIKRREVCLQLENYTAFTSPL